MTSTLKDLVREAHPHHVVEPLDATVRTDLLLCSPTVIIEVIGAREGIDVLARVRRVAPDAPLAAMRISAIDVEPEHPERRAGARLQAGAAGVLAFAVAVGLAIWDPPVMSPAVSVGAMVALPVLAVALVRAWRRTRRTPVERRRYFERRRSITVIAVVMADEISASALASTVRRELDGSRPGVGRVDVSVFDPPPCGGG